MRCQVCIFPVGPVQCLGGSEFCPVLVQTQLAAVFPPGTLLQDSKWHPCGTGDGLSHEIPPLTPHTYTCLIGLCHSASACDYIKKPTGPAPLWLDSSAFLVNSPFSLTAGGDVLAVCCSTVPPSLVLTHLQVSLC